MTLRPNICFMFGDNSTCGQVKEVLERRSVSNCFGRGSLGERTGSGKPKKGKAPGKAPERGLCRVWGLFPPCPTGAAGSGRGQAVVRILTLALTGSTSMRSPSLMASMASAAPTTAGMSSSLDSTAAWHIGPPSAVTSPPTRVSTML